MKTLTYIALTLLVAGGCKKPVATPRPVTGSVKGSLVYRTTCLDGISAPFPGVDHSGGPLLFLANASGSRVSQFAKPGLDGSFTLRGIQPGAYRLRLLAGKLQDFWMGTPLHSFAVNVTATTVDVGTVCADTTPIRNTTTKATWGVDESMAAAGNSLHVWRAAGSVTLSVEGEARSGHSILEAEWSAGIGEISNNASETRWSWPAEVSEASLTGVVNDGYGSFKIFQVPMRLHDRRFPTAPLGGWMAASDLVSNGVVALITSAPSVTWDTSGGQLRAVLSDAQAAMRAQFVGSFAVTQPVTFIMPMYIRQLPVNSHIDLGFTGSNSELAAVRLAHLPSGFRLDLVKNKEFVLASVPIDTVLFNEGVQLYLRFDPATLDLQGGFGTMSPILFVRGSLSNWRPDRVAPFVRVEKVDPAQGESLDVSVSGFWSDVETTLVTLPAEIGVWDGVTYDQATCISQGKVYFINEGRAYAASQTAVMAFDRHYPLARALVQLNGCAITAYVDMQLDEVTSMVDRVDDWSPEMIVPISDGRAYLY